MNTSAYAEVYQIIQYLPEEEYKLIPKEKIDYIKKNMDKNFRNICTYNTNIEDINLSYEASEILLSLFYNDIANEKQKKQLEFFLAKQEQKSIEQFDVRELFTSKNTSINNASLVYEVSSIKNKIDVNDFTMKNYSKNQLIVINENSWNYKVKKFIRQLLDKFRKKQI